MFVDVPFVVDVCFFVNIIVGLFPGSISQPQVKLGLCHLTTHVFTGMYVYILNSVYKAPSDF